MYSIYINKKADCCGCAACADACPMQCIEMKEDAETFIYPYVDRNRCIQCGKCINVCPIKNAEGLKNKNDADEAFAFVSNDTELIRSSSSGGAFSAVMDAFVHKHDAYAIAGAAFDGTLVKHVCVNDRKEADIFKKSKYVQSYGRHIYQRVREELKEGKYVLFSGTPCMVAALKAYVGELNERLLTIDIVCHGVPSRSVFEKYLSELSKEYNSDVRNVEFRVKKDLNTAAPNPRTVNVVFQNMESVNLDISHCEYLYGFHTGLFFRPSCARCKFACKERTGDITLGDYWGIEKINSDFQSKRGVSLVHVNTSKGKEYFEHLKTAGRVFTTPYSFACAENEQLRVPANCHRNRSGFFILQKLGLPVITTVRICQKPDYFHRKIVRRICDIAYRAFMSANR